MDRGGAYFLPQEGHRIQTDDLYAVVHMQADNAQEFQ